MNTKLLNSLSNEDLELITKYRQYYSDNYDAECEGPFMESRQWLEPWSRAKTNLFKLLGEQLTYTIPMDNISGIAPENAEQTAVGLAKDLFKDLLSYQSDSIELFVRQFRNAIADNFPWYLRDSVIRYLKYPLCYSALPNEHVYTPKDETILRFSEGMKPMKAIVLICKKFNIPMEEGFEQYRILASRVLQNFSQKNCHITLSIHPLDYMTMSDNSNNWSSCMSWDNDGCYKSGTVEMLNSPFVLIAYISSVGPYRIPRAHFSWNNKIWRQLFIYAPDQGFFSVKAYPNSNAVITQKVLSTLADLYHQNISATEELSSISEYHPDDPDRNPHDIYFLTSRMYNDFGAARHYAIYLPSAHQTSINYSGDAECINCGQINFPYTDPEQLTCNPGETWTCVACGETFDEDEAQFFSTDGQGPYDEECYSELFYFDELSESDVRYNKEPMREDPVVLWGDETHYRILDQVSQDSYLSSSFEHITVQNKQGRKFDALKVPTNHFAFYNCHDMRLTIVENNEPKIVENN